MKVKVYLTVCLAVLFGAGNVFSQGFLDYRDSFKLVDWKFYKGDIHLAESAGDIPEQGWEDVKVPHTWNAEDVLTEGDHYYQGIGWYRSGFDLPPEQKGKPFDKAPLDLARDRQGRRYFIRFEGVSVVADVFVNGTYAGGHKGGYSAFCFEITPYVRLNKHNRISVRVDNSMQVDVAPSGTYLYPLFGGIYRPVTIFSTDDLCISPLDYASSGVYIKPVKVSEKQADIEVVTLLDNKKTAAREQDDEKAKALIKTTVLDDMGNTVAQAQKKVSLASNQLTQIILKMHIDNPRLWNGRKDPYLYKMDVRIEDLKSNMLDRIEQPLGLRFFEVDRDKGLLLNGQPYHLHGVCRHQEWQGLGPALTDAHHEKDIELILEVGANGVRLAHYQQADKMYSLCDEKGLVVWAEIPNTPAYRAENPKYVQNCKDQLTELIKQNYNHPSILFWGMYNEIPISKENVKALHQTAKQLDPYRLTTQADFAQPTARHFETDVVAWNWYFGWYYDNFNRYISWYDNLHKRYPRLKGGLSEYGADGCITQQQENPSRPEPQNGKFFPEQYQRLYHEQVWKNIKDRDDIWCKFIWNMFDFSWTAANRGDRPYINHKGLVTHDRKAKKDSFYFYKANWSEEPVLYILSRRNIQRAEEMAEVAVYTNLDQVELYVNGKLISKKNMESDIHKIVWKDVVLTPGQNQINVISQKGDEKYTDACEWAYVKNKD